MASLDGGPDGADSKPSPATDRQPDGSPGITEQQEAGQETTSRASAPSTAREEARDEDEDDRSLARIHSVAIPLPRIKIKYCTQCRWMLRAAYVGARQNDLYAFLQYLVYVMAFPCTSAAYLPQPQPALFFCMSSQYFHLCLGTIMEALVGALLDYLEGMRGRKSKEEPAEDPRWSCIDCGSVASDGYDACYCCPRAGRPGRKEAFGSTPL